MSVCKAQNIKLLYFQRHIEAILPLSSQIAKRQPVAQFNIRILEYFVLLPRISALRVINFANDLNIFRFN